MTSAVRRLLLMAAARRLPRSPPRQPAVAAIAAAGTVPGAAPPPWPPSGPLRRRRPLFAAAALLFAAAVPVACGHHRERARLAELEAGIASAQASLAALSGAAPSGLPPPPSPLRTAPFRPVAAVSSHTGARPVAASALLGAGPDALLRWFGDPDLRRPEGEAEVRLYLGPGCALDVVLYAAAPGGGGGMRVAHAAARAEGAAAVTEADCLRGVGSGGAGRAAAAGHSGGR